MIELLQSEDFSNFAGSVQSILLSLAIILGGAWAVFAFFAQRNEWHIRKQPLIKLSLDVSQQSLPDDSRLYLHAVVVAKNDGNIVDYIHYTENDHFSVTEYQITEDRERVPVDRITRVLKRSQERPVDFNTLLPNSTVEIPFWICVPRTGLYHVRFYFHPNKQQKNALSQAGHFSTDDSVVISVNKYIVVK